MIHRPFLRSAIQVVGDFDLQSSEPRQHCVGIYPQQCTPCTFNHAHESFDSFIHDSFNESGFVITRHS